MRDWDSVLGFLSDNINTSGERRKIVYAFIPDMIDEGINQTNALRIFQNNNMGIRSSDFADIYQSFTKDNDLFVNIQSLNGDDYIAENMMQRSTSLNESRFRWIANVSYTDEDGETFVFKNFSIRSDDNRTLDEIYEELYKDIKELYNIPKESIHSAQIVNAYYNDTFWNG